MNVLLLDQTSCFVDFALRCRNAGHNVRVCMGVIKETKLRSPIGDGLVEKIEREEWQKHIGWADLIVASDNVRWLRELDIQKKRGQPVFAPSYESAELELDRAKGQKFLADHGVKVIPYKTFSDYGAAEKYVRETMERYVSKPNGDRDKALSYVSQSPADMVYMLQRWKASQKNVVGQFMLQEFVPGIEFAVNGWLGKNGFSRFIEESFEHKRLMNDDKGPNTGEMGTAVKYVEESDLAKEVLLPLERDLIKMGHTGSIDVSVIIDENGDPRPLEFTARLGWPAFNIVQELHPEPCDWMLDLIDGEDTFVPLLDHAIGVVIAMPDFPYSKLTKKEVSGVPIYHLDDENPFRRYIAPSEVMDGKAPAMVDDKIVDKRMMVTAGDYLAVCTGIGDTVREAQAMAYKVVESLDIPNSTLYRTDIGSRLKKEVPQLQQYGFAKEWTW
jgi:phosphoribosylamine--glycine ligase